MTITTVAVKHVCAIIENRNSMLCILKASKSIKKQKISIKMQKMSKKSRTLFRGKPKSSELAQFHEEKR